MADFLVWASILAIWTVCVTVMFILTMLRKEKEKPILITSIVGIILQLGISIALILTGKICLLGLEFLGIIGLVIFYTVGIKDQEKVVPYSVGFCMISWLIVGIAAGIGSTGVEYTHTIKSEYVISIENNKAQVEVSSNPEAQEAIQKRANEVSDFDYVYDEGIVTVVYRCNVPFIHNNNHSQCICSSEEICDFCEKFVSRKDVIIESKILTMRD